MSSILRIDIRYKEIFIITLLLGWRFIYSTDYDSWLQEL